MPLLLAGPVFSPGGAIPSEYTCDGADISRPLNWSGVREGTQSLVLIVDGPDAPSGVFRHWAAFDMPPSAPGLTAGYGPNRPAVGFRVARNDFGAPDYGGPCRLKGMPFIIITSACLQYHFRLFAISRPTLDLIPSASAFDVLQAAQS